LTTDRNDITTSSGGAALDATMNTYLNPNINNNNKRPQSPQNSENPLNEILNLFSQKHPVKKHECGPAPKPHAVYSSEMKPPISKAFPKNVAKNVEIFKRIHSRNI
jgi:hypothetical protein